MPISPYRQVIAAEIRSQMARSKITSAYMTASTGIASSTLSKKINGGSPFTTDELESVANVLGVQPSALLPELVDGNAA